MSLVSMKSSTSPFIQRIYTSFKYYTFDVWDDAADDRMAHFPLMSGGPWTMITLIAIYLYIVKYWGPKVMKDRKPFHVNDVMICYNFLMVIFSGWMFFEAMVYLNFGIDCWRCKDFTGMNDIPTRRFLFVAWLFLFSKLLEFADTFFMVIRKKNSHISNLHVIHHSIVPFCVWMGLKFEPLGANNFFPLINSGVHTLMYTYYGLAATGDTFSGMQQRLKPLKPWITRLQISQFLLAIVHCIIATSNKCDNFPKTFLILNLSNALLFLGLFFNFYLKCYRSKITIRPVTISIKKVM